MYKVIKPKKQLGQHYLTDTLVIEQILKAINPKKEETFLEIGSGKGVLTKKLLDRTKFIHSVEIDKDLIPELKKLELLSNDVNIHQVNILNIKLENLSQNLYKYRIVGNLPYNISTQIMLWSIQNLRYIKDLHYMFQKEFGERLISSPGSKSYGRLSVLSQYMFQSLFLFKILPESFKPRPSVDSIFLRLVPRKEKDVDSREAKKLQEVTQLLFSKRRKKISTSFKNILSQNEIIDLRIDPDDRPESLAVNDFVRLANYLLINSNG